MIKKVIALLFVLAYPTNIHGNIIEDFIQHLVQVNDNITKVRTQEEYEKGQNEHEFVVYDFVGLVQRFDGYKAEEYEILTDDGYKLKLHRIISSPKSNKVSGKPVVFLEPCLFGSSDIYVELGPTQDLGYLLADAGFDVWIGNFRGNSYGKNHVKYSTMANNTNFWGFGMDELALIDLPINIDTVLEKTKSQNLTYIGFSMGTTLSFMLLSAKPDYNDKMNLVISLAPIVYFKDPLGFYLKILKYILPVLIKVVDFIKVYEISPQSRIFILLGHTLCELFDGQFCGIIGSKYLFGSSSFNRSVIKEAISYVPAGASLQTIQHYDQLINTENFQFYDYGSSENNVTYHSTDPPLYDIRKVTSPQTIFYSLNDIFLNENSLDELKKQLKNADFQKAPEYYNHMDFIWNKGTVKDIYEPLIKIIESKT